MGQEERAAVSVLSRRNLRDIFMCSRYFLRNWRLYVKHRYPRAAVVLARFGIIKRVWIYDSSKGIEHGEWFVVG